jgi:hypothetical protein
MRGRGARLTGRAHGSAIGVVPLALALVLLVTPTLVACGGAAGGEARAADAPARASAPPATPFPDDPSLVARVHSRRFRISFSLPDRAAWSIDDQSGPSWVATHASTESRLRVELVRGTDLVNRARCEDRARELGWLDASLDGRRRAPGSAASAAPARTGASERSPDRVPERGALRTVEDAVTVGPEAFDTRVWVAIAPGASSEEPIVGHVFAFGAYVRTCLLFHFETRVASAASDAALSSRLAVVRQQVLGSLRLDALEDVPREAPQSPGRGP